MKRLHVHVGVHDLTQSIRFYSTLFGAQPTVLRDDYAKWQLDDPRVNFAISQRGRAAGLDHLGIQVDGAAELAAVHARLEGAGETVRAKGTTECCYARSDKGWVTDPSGVAWETFWTHGEATTYGDSRLVDAATGKAACCDPAPAEAAAPVAAKAGAAACCGPRALASPCDG